MDVTKSFALFCNMWNLPMPLITEEHLKRGTKIGKLVQRELLKSRPDLKNDSFLNIATQCGVEAWNAKQYVEKVKICNGRDAIAAIYNDTNVRSCMTGEGDKIADFYAANNIRVAYMVNSHGEATARCLVLQDDMFNDTYGPAGNQLKVALEEIGMKITQQLFDTGTVLSTPSKYLPYFDNWIHMLAKVDDGRIMATNIAMIDLADGPDSEEVQAALDGLQELLDEGYEYIVYPQKHEVPTTEGVHYCVDEYDETSIIDLVAKFEAYLTVKAAEEEEPEVTRYWDQRRINGRLFWVFNKWATTGWIEPYRLIMDDYGMGQTVRYYAGDNPVRTEIELGEFGRF